MLLDKNFSLQTKAAYTNSKLPGLLNNLKENFKGIDIVSQQLEPLMHLLFLKSLINKQEVDELSLHMAFSGKMGTGKSSVALKCAKLLRHLNYLTKGHLISVTREDLVGQYIGHTAPKTRDILKKSQGGILFIDQSSQLYKSNNEKDYGAEAIEIILQLMESQRKNLAIIFSDEKLKLDSFFGSNPGISSRVGTHIFFENYCVMRLVDIFSSVLKKEGEFFLEKRTTNIVHLCLSQLLEESNFSNIRSLQLLSYKVLTFQSKRVYGSNGKKQLSFKNLIRVNKADFKT